jgi:hypothetical protein
MVGDWVPVAPVQLSDALLSSRRALKELARSSPSSEGAAAEVDDILQLSLDAVPVEDWPVQSANAFVSAVARSGSALLNGSSTTLASDQIARIQTVADLLVSLSIARASDLRLEVKVAACRLWTVTRLSAVPPTALQAFVETAVRLLAPVGVPESELRSAIQSETLASFAARLPAAQNLPVMTPSPNTRHDELLRPPDRSFPTPTETSITEIQREGNIISEAAAAPSTAAPVTPSTEDLGSNAAKASPSISAEDPRAPTPIARQRRRPIQSWATPFTAEYDVLRDYPKLIDDLVAAAAELPSLPRNLVRKLKDTLRQYRSTKEHDLSRRTSFFFGAAVDGAVEIAVGLLDSGNIGDAYRIANTFAEVAKVLISRNRSTYQSPFERLLATACRAVARSRMPDDDAIGQAPVAGEIERLLSDLTNIMRKALSTYFRSRDGVFLRGRMDDSLLERLVNNVVAAYFDQRLKYILERNRPQVKEFVRSNLPLVYRLPVSPEWTKNKRIWRKTLETAGYADLVNSIDDDLVDPTEVGKVPEEFRDEITSAAARNDYDRVIELLKESATDLQRYLSGEAQRLLQYRPPGRPQLTDARARGLFEKAQSAARSLAPDRLKSALRDMQAAWALDLNNLDLRDWVAYLEAKTDNLVAAAQNYDKLRQLRPERNFVTEWNLAVLHYERRDEAGAYKLLVPLLETAWTDSDFMAVLLALSLKRNDKQTFLSILPRTMSLRYHPLGIYVANEIGDRARAEALLAQLLAQWRGTWELPDVEKQFNNLEDLQQGAVNKAIVEGQTEQVILWLEARIKSIKGWVPNYKALSIVHEKWTLDYDQAFDALSRRLDMTLERAPQSWNASEEDLLRYRRSLDEACEDLLEFCRRLSRTDLREKAKELGEKAQKLGEKAYQMSAKAGAREELLQSFSDFAPPQGQRTAEPSLPPEPQAPVPSPPPADPKLADRVIWVTAGLVKIRNVSTYLERAKEIEELARIAEEMGPSESGEALTIIRNITGVLETFSKTTESPDDRSTRRTLYARVVGEERQLAQLLSQNALSRPLTNLITPFRQALQYVVGELSRLAGVGPDVDVTIENTFISRGVDRSTIVLRVTDKSERPVTDIAVEVASETPSLLLGASRKWNIPKLESQRSELVTIPIERAEGTTHPAEATFAVSLRASAEGSPDVNLPIKKLSIPFKSFPEAVGTAQLKRRFKERPLGPAEPELFHGRSTLLEQIRSSFSAGSQGERYFFDGIRRVGKTSLLNFLPSHLPPTVFPVLVSFDLHPIRGRFSSATTLETFATIIAEEAATTLQRDIAVPAVSAFETDPGRAFNTFLGAFHAAVPDRVPLLMVDEFQDLLKEISHSGDGRDRDTVVLDLLRGLTDAGKVFAVFTGSVRFERLAAIAGGEIRIFGSMKEVPVSFLSASSVRDVLNAGMTPWGVIPPETAAAVYDCTGGYPWHVQKYGLELWNMLNEEQRTIATPRDVDAITDDRILPYDSLFKFWWDAEQLGSDEERLVERLLRQSSGEQPIVKRVFLADLPYKDRDKFKDAIDSLKACEVLDSRQPEYLRFGGRVLRRWLEQHVQDGQLRIPRPTESVATTGKVGIFIDHENMFHSLRSISEARGIPMPERGTKERLTWFAKILEALMLYAERQLGRERSEMKKVAVAFWDRPAEAELSRIYYDLAFETARPVDTGKGNEVDFKLADEIRRAREQASREGSALRRALIITGDVDLSHSTQALKNDGVDVQVVAGSQNISDKYILLVGPANFVALQDVVGL